MSELLATKMKREAKSFKPKKSSPYSPRSIMNKWEKFKMNRDFLKQKKICISIIEQAAKKGKRKAYIYVAAHSWLSDTKCPRGKTYLRVDMWERSRMRKMLIDEGFKVKEYLPKTQFEGDMELDVQYGPFGEWYCGEGFFNLFVWVVKF